MKKLTVLTIFALLFCLRVSAQQPVITQSGSTTVVTGTVAVTGSFFQATQPVSCATALTCPVAATLNAETTKVIGTVNQGTSPWIITGPGTAGSPGTSVLTIQGVGSGTAVPVSGSFFQATQPVSNSGTFAVQAAQSGTWTVTGAGGTFPVTGTFFQATQPVSCATAGTCPVAATLNAETTKVIGTVNQGTSPWIIAGAGTAGTPGTAVLTVQGVGSGTALPVSGTFFQSTQPVSCANAATCPVTATIAASQTIAVTNTGTFADQSTLQAGSANIGSVESTDGTHIAIIDPCQGQTKVFTLISITTGTQVVTGTASKKQYVCEFQITTATTQNIALIEGSGSVCASSPLGLLGGATAATGFTFVANEGIVIGNGSSAIAATTVNANNICVLTSSTGQISGNLVSVAQ